MRSPTTRALGLVVTTAILGLAPAACGRADDRGTATDRDGTIDGGGVTNTNAMTQDTAGDQWIVAVLATIDRSEIQSSRVALQQARAGAVKEYARMMIDEHRRTSEQLADLARNANVTLPDTATLDRDLGVGAADGTATTGSSASSTQPAAGGAGTMRGDTNAGSRMSGGPTTATGNPVGTGSAASGTGRGGEAMVADSAQARSAAAGGTRAPMTILRELHRDAQRTMAELRPLRGADFDRAYMQAQVAMHTKSLNALGTLSASARDQALRRHIDEVTRHVQEHLQRAQTVSQGLGGGR